MLGKVTATTVANQTVQGSNGVRYAYRRFGNSGGGVPVVLLQHFRGNLDNWDPALLDALAGEREVIAFNNVGVASTDGTTPNSVTQMARDAISSWKPSSLRKSTFLDSRLAASSPRRSPC